MKPEKEKKTEIIAFRETSTNVRKMESKAKKSDKPLTNWIRETLNAAV